MLLVLETVTQSRECIILIYIGYIILNFSFFKIKFLFLKKKSTRTKPSNGKNYIFLFVCTLKLITMKLCVSINLIQFRDIRYFLAPKRLLSCPTIQKVLIVNLSSIKELDLEYWSNFEFSVFHFPQRSCQMRYVYLEAYM